MKIKNDQKRVETPGTAIKNGSNILVIGRSITNSKDPIYSIKKIENIENEIQKSKLKFVELIVINQLKPVMVLISLDLFSIKSPQDLLLHLRQKKFQNIYRLI